MTRHFHYPSQRRLFFACLSAGFLLLARAASAADTIYYLDVNGGSTGSGVTPGGNYTWNTGIWTQDSTGDSPTSSPGWTSGTNYDVAFVAGSDAGSNAFTVTLPGGGAQTWLNNLSVNSGNPTIAVNGGNFVLGTNAYWQAAAGSTLTVSGAGSGSWGALNMNTYSLTVAGAGNMVIAGMGDSTGGLTVNSSGVLTINGASNYTGNTLITSGTLALGNASGIQSSTLDTSGGGTFSFGGLTSATFGGLTNGGSLSLTNTASAGVALSAGNNGVTTTYSGVLSGSGSLIKIGGGMLTLAGTNIYTGTTAVNGGVLVASTTAGLAGLGTSTFTVASGAALGGQISGAGWSEAQIAALLSQATFSAGSAVAIDTSNGNYAYSQSLPMTAASGVGLTKTGPNMLTLSYSNGYTGPTLVTGGTLNFATGSSLAAPAISTPRGAASWPSPGR